EDALAGAVAPQLTAGRGGDVGAAGLGGVGAELGPRAAALEGGAARAGGDGQGEQEGEGAKNENGTGTTKRHLARLPKRNAPRQRGSRPILMMRGTVEIMRARGTTSRRTIRVGLPPHDGYHALVAFVTAHPACDIDAPLARFILTRRVRDHGAILDVHEG